MMYACAIVLLLFSLALTRNFASGAPSSWSEKSEAEQLSAEKLAYLRLVQAMLTRLQEVKDKRTRADAGFLSRHDAMSDYFKSAIADRLAYDPLGPGKRK